MARLVGKSFALSLVLHGLLIGLAAFLSYVFWVEPGGSGDGSGKSGIMDISLISTGSPLPQKISEGKRRIDTKTSEEKEKPEEKMEIDEITLIFVSKPAKKSEKKLEKETETEFQKPQEAVPTSSRQEGGGLGIGRGSGIGIGKGGLGVGNIVLARYFDRLRRHFQSKLIYPAQARRQGVSGRTLIRFTVLENGDIPKDSIRLQETSGEKILDDAALETVRKSSPAPEPPEEYGDMTIEIPVSFSSR